MFVFFPDEAKIGIKTIKTYCTRMQEENIHRAIVVVQAGMFNIILIITFLYRVMPWGMPPAFVVQWFMPVHGILGSWRN